MADYETWLLDIGDTIIQRKASQGYESLSRPEKAIYCFWVVDYAIRNSGTLGPMEELHPSSMKELSAFASSEECSNLGALVAELNMSGASEAYYSAFPKVCSELEARYGT